MKSHVERVLGIPLSEQQYVMLKEDWNAFTEEPYKYSVYASMVVDYLNNKPKGKIELLQEVLRASLTDEQVSYLKEYWKAFYNNPEDFIEDRLIDFIVEDMGLVQFEEKEIKKMEFNWKQFVELNPGIIAKISDDKTLGYNKDGIFARLLNRVFVVRTTNARNMEVPRVYGIWSDDVQTFIMAIPKESKVVAEDIFIDFKFLGYFAPGEGMTWSEVEFMSFAYVPFTDGPQGSVIPVLWRTLEGYDNTGIDIASISATIGNSGVLSESMKGFSEFIADRFPTVDLKEQKDKRYVGLAMRMATGATMGIVYNRNHVAYNGNMAGEIKTLPITCAVAATRWDEVHTETLSQYLNDDYHNSLIVNAGQRGVYVGEITPEGAKAIRQASNVVIQGMNSQKVLETETNPLLRAAKMASGTVE